MDKPRNICLSKEISFFKSGKISSSFFSGLIKSNNFFLYLGFSFKRDISMSPKNDNIIVLGIGVAEIRSKSQFFPPFLANLIL